MSKHHTLGPWHAEENTAGDAWGVYADSDRLGPGQVEPDLIVVAVDLSEANARLIAAAPDLLVACRWAEEYLDPPAGIRCDAIDGIELLIRIRAAIARATGESA